MYNVHWVRHIVHLYYLAYHFEQICSTIQWDPAIHICIYKIYTVEPAQVGGSAA